MQMIFERLMTLFGSSESPDNPQIRFGRYSDSFKYRHKHAEWERTEALYSKGDFLAYFETFLKYIYDEKEKNLNYTRKDDLIDFEFFQGSKRIKGTATNDSVVAEAKFARFKEPSVNYMRKLMELNFSMRYSSFAIIDDLIVVRFQSRSTSANPEKLYYGLRELATRADKFDDLFVEEFDPLMATDTDHLVEISEEQKEAKFKHLQIWIKAVKDQVNLHAGNTHFQPIPYLLLSFAYRIDYLIAPEGRLMDLVEKMHASYFAPENLTVEEKCGAMMKYFRDIEKLSREQVFEELYHVKGTFGVTRPTSHAILADFIRQEKDNLKWYHEKGETAIASAIIEYVVLYILFNFGVNPPTRQLIHVIMEFLNPDYFMDLGFELNHLDTRKGAINKRFLIKKLDQIEAEAREQYPRFKINAGELNYDSQDKFLFSLIESIEKLDYFLS